MASFMAYFSQILLLVLGIFLMIIVLLQRGRGGGLAGAFGGMGGQSAFGSKAGDVFTKITIVVAVLWVVVSGGSGFFLRAAAEKEGESRFENTIDDDSDTTDDATGADGPLIPPQPPQPPGDSTTTTPAPTGDATPGEADTGNEESGTSEDGATSTEEDAPTGGDPAAPSETDTSTPEN